MSLLHFCISSFQKASHLSSPSPNSLHTTTALILKLGLQDISSTMPLDEILTSVPQTKIPPHHTLTSLSLTHVQFSDNDIYSKIFAHLTLSPLAITCGIIATVLTTRDLTVILMLIGQLLNECTNFALKRCVKQARPTGTDLLPDRTYHDLWRSVCSERPWIGQLTLSLSREHVEYLGDGYGMPSSHSQFMAYFATYVIILMFRW